MNCIVCNRRLRCTESRQISTTSRYREYLCFNCKRVYISTESIDSVPMRKRDSGIQKIITRLKGGKGND